jgi:diacylglycerol kinase (ATP)
LFFTACNTKFTGKGMLLAPDAETGDGKVDVVLVRRASRWQMLKMFHKVFDGSHMSLPVVEHYQVRSFSIQPEARDLLNLDGELKGSAPASAEVMPGAVRIFA